MNNSTCYMEVNTKQTIDAHEKNVFLGISIPTISKISIKCEHVTKTEIGFLIRSILNQLIR
jgi:hypothetical protein